MLGGGGQLPRAVFEHFIACAGGKEARILFAPTASPRIVNEQKNRTMAMFTQLGAKEVMLLAARHPSEVSDSHIAMINRCLGNRDVAFTGAVERFATNGLEPL